MRKDFKTGMALGVVLVMGAGVWFISRPAQRPQARFESPPGSTIEQRQSAEQAEVYIDHYDSSYSAESYWPETDSAGPAGIEQDTVAVETGRASEQIEADDEPTAEYSHDAISPVFHTVAGGETLSEISQRYYGTAGNWQKIFEANRKSIKDAHKLVPGTRLVIPE